MTSEDTYFRQLARIRQALQQGSDLPDYLRPHAQEVTEEVRERARKARQAVLQGDIQALRDQALGLAAAGFDRDAYNLEEEIPELDTARNELRNAGEDTEDGDQQDEQDRPGDPQ